MNSENSLYSLRRLKSFDKNITLTTSKSHSNRALILGAVCGGNFKVYNVSTSSDVKNLLNAFKKIGLKMQIEGTSIVFENSFPACENETPENIIELQTGDGGTTNRFLIALLSRGKKEYHLYPTEKMSERPIEDLINPLRRLNVHISQFDPTEKNDPWIKLKGPASMYNTTKLEIDCQKSTQFASALMLAFSNLPLQFEFINLHASEAYLKMTSLVIKRSLENNHYTIPVDFSSLSYPAAFAALMGRVLIENCTDIDNSQADSAFINLLKTCGANVLLSQEGLEITQGQSLRPFSFNVSEAPDLFPTLVFLASHIEGESVLRNLGILKFKESDRLQQMIMVLKQFDVKFKYDSSVDTLKLIGQSTSAYQKAVVHPARDHRIVMSAALFMLKNNGGELFECDCVEKSFPEFFSIFGSVPS